MAVIIEGFAVILKRSTVGDVYPGGLQKLLDDSPVPTICPDEYIINISFMDPRDLDAYTSDLETQGFV